MRSPLRQPGCDFLMRSVAALYKRRVLEVSAVTSAPLSAGSDRRYKKGSR
jgi:hypothetical protein